MNSIIVPLPPQEDHARIVRQIEMIQEESKRLQDNYNQKLAALNELKQTILQKAFSGELTAQPGAEMQEEAA
jgi:type I restriction enzyme S subunit